MFTGRLTLIMVVEIVPAQSVCVFDTNPWQFHGSGEDRRQNRDNGRRWIRWGCPKFRAVAGSCGTSIIREPS